MQMLYKRIFKIEIEDTPTIDRQIPERLQYYIRIGILNEHLVITRYTYATFTPKRRGNTIPLCI